MTGLVLLELHQGRLVQMYPIRPQRILMTFKLGESIKVTSIYYLDTTRINTCVWERGNTFLLITALFVKMSFADFPQLFFHQCLLDPLILHQE